MSAPGEGLNTKQRKFAEEFVIDCNATAAYLRAGYKTKNIESAYVSASRLLSHAKVQEYISHLRAQQLEETGITVQRVLKEYAAIAFSDVTDALEFDANGVTLKASRTLPKEVKAAIVSVQSRDTKDGISFSLKMHDKVACLTKLGEYLGMFDNLNRAIDTVTKAGYQVYNPVTEEMVNNQDSDEESD